MLIKFLFFSFQLFWRTLFLREIIFCCLDGIEKLEIKKSPVRGCVGRDLMIRIARQLSRDDVNDYYAIEKLFYLFFAP